MNTELIGFSLGVSLVSLVAMTPVNGAQETANALNPRMFLPNVLSNRVPPTPSEWRIIFIGSDTPQAYPAKPQLFQMNGEGKNLKTLVNLIGDSMPGYAPYQKPYLWSPDGNKIAYMHGILGLFDVNTGMTRTLVPITTIRTLAWSPESDAVSYADDESRILRYDLKTNIVTTVTNNTTTPTFFGSFDNFSQVPDFWRPGESLYSFSNDENKIIFVRSDGTNMTEVTNGSQPTWAPSFDRIAYVRAASVRILIFDRINGIKSDIELANFTDGSWVSMLDWSPDEKNLLINTQGGGGLIKMYRIKTDGSEKAPEFIGYGHDPVWTPDSKGIIYSDLGGVQLLKQEPGSKPITLAKLHSSLKAVRIVP